VKMKFEYIFAALIVIVLTIALFLFKESTELATTIVTAFVGALGMIAGFLFKKDNPKE